MTEMKVKQLTLDHKPLGWKQAVAFYIQQLFLTDAQAQPSAFHQLDSRGHTIHFKQAQNPANVHVVIHNNVRDTGTQWTLRLSSILLDLFLEDLTSGTSYSSRQKVNCDSVKSVSWAEEVPVSECSILWHMQYLVLSVFLSDYSQLCIYPTTISCIYLT